MKVSRFGRQLLNSDLPSNKAPLEMVLLLLPTYFLFSLCVLSG